MLLRYYDSNSIPPLTVEDIILIAHKTIWKLRSGSRICFYCRENNACFSSSHEMASTGVVLSSSLTKNGENDAI